MTEPVYVDWRGQEIHVGDYIYSPMTRGSSSPHMAEYLVEDILPDVILARLVRDSSGWVTQNHQGTQPSRLTSLSKVTKVT